jgi:acyl-CoA dehydrogenase
MNDEQRMLADMTSGLFEELGPSATLNVHWAGIEDVALPGLLLPEELGGFGGTWEMALIVFRLTGYHSVALPIAEAAIAASIAGRAQGRGTIAAGAAGTCTGGRFTGEITGICWGKGADFLIAPAPQGGAMIIEATDLVMDEQANIAGESRSTANAQDLSVTLVDADVFAMGALARAAQIAGALDSALARSVAYANERQQFGRALGKFQAVQQSLATMACESAASNCAAMGAAQGMARGVERFQIAAAKLRANRAVGVGTALAHQVHGAIGFTEEYTLHPLTRRLWAWRSEFGNDSFWGNELGARIVSRGADNFWADLTALTD